ncbi:MULTISPECIES: 3'-5' exonuclease [Caloramator]|uniref:Exonuclease, DNA polymerase III, epsilon subunit family n=1 Tax=Caloramator proteoclasticus DSM 10124 TaxID=1121262 RepID=A0A1M4TBP2_9CLOT|nr:MULTISPECIES: exonuclease domain-containing protein [Caloramator]SHE41784.1 exonuclease, DNA polymerase III, epsilon subunit family [Caloramator proteoclasticus DSM 10124]
MSIKKIIYSEKVYKSFVALDLETTGLHPESDKIVEIAAIKYDNYNIIDSFHTLINPKIEIPSYITSINGISNDMVKTKPTIDQVFPKFIKFIEDLPIVAHNAGFDGKFIKYSSFYLYNKDIINNIFIDTVKIAKKIYPQLPNHKLETIKNFYGLNLKSHRAYDDTLVAANIYMDYCKRQRGIICP